MAQPSHARSETHMEESPAVAETGDVLSERDAALLDFERAWWSADAAKDHEIRTRFGVSTTRYYQILNGLLDDPAALAHDPLLVKRLRRLRESRQRARSAERLARR